MFQNGSKASTSPRDTPLYVETLTYFGQVWADPKSDPLLVSHPLTGKPPLTGKGPPLPVSPPPLLVTHPLLVRHPLYWYAHPYQ